MRDTAKTAILEAMGSLKDFLDGSGQKSDSIKISFELHPSVKDLIESRGIPHTEIFKLTVNGRKRTLEYNVRDGDNITAYPFESVDPIDFDPIFSQPSSFIADVHLGKLAKNLRLLGIDTEYRKSWDDTEIIHLSNKQKRMILTRDIELLKNGETQFGCWVRSANPERQIEELFKRFNLAGKIKPFSRCMKCNGLLHQTDLKKVENRIPPKVKKWHSDFFECADCRQVYWQGSHFKNLEERVADLTRLTQ